MRNCRRPLRSGSASTAFLRQLCESSGLRDSDDGSIWNFAVEGSWTVVTKDEDFVARCVLGGDAPPVVWLRVGNCTNRVLFARMEPLLSEINNRLSAGEKVVEVR